MRHNLTETHIAGIAAGVLAIVIIVVAVVLMSVAKPPDPGGNGTISPTVGTTETETQTNTTHTLVSPPSTEEPTDTPTDTPTSSTPPPDVNKGIDTSKVSVIPQCTNTKDGVAKYQIKNNNAKKATIQYASTTGSGDSGTAEVPGGVSVEITIPTTGNDTALTIEFPGINDNTHAGKVYNQSTESCGGSGGGNNTTDTPSPSPEITFTDQTAKDGKTVTIEKVTAPKGGFVVLSTETNRKAGVSDYLSSGTKNKVSISLSAKLEKEKEVTATLYKDTNGNKQFDGGDTAYMAGGSQVSQTATVSAGSGWPF